MSYGDNPYASWYQQQAAAAAGWNGMPTAAYGAAAASSYPGYPSYGQVAASYAAGLPGAYGYGYGGGTQYTAGYAQGQPQDGPTSLWIGDLEEYMDENFLYAAFETLGEPLLNVRIIRDKKPGSTSRCNYGFLQFPDYETAKRVHLKYNNKSVPNSHPQRKFKLNEAQFNKPGEPREQVQEWSLFVGDLTPDVDDYNLYQAFSGYPSCRGARVVVDMEGNSKGYGFVRFSNETEQQKALIEMQWYRGCGGKPIKVSLATQKSKMVGMSSGGASSDAASTWSAAPSTLYQEPQQPAQTSAWDWGAAAAGYIASGYYANAAAAPTQPPPSLPPVTNTYQYPTTSTSGGTLSNQQQSDGGSQTQPASTSANTQSNPGSQLVDHSPPFDVDVENMKYIAQSEELYEAVQENTWGLPSELELSQSIPVQTAAH